MPEGIEPSIREQTLTRVDTEVAFAVAKHGAVNTPLNVELSRTLKLAVLTEEVGEVARVLCDAALGHAFNARQLHDELMQVAAVAVMWAESEQVIMERGHGE